MALNKIRQPIAALAPMDGITDHPMRLTYCQTFKPDLVFTEFINVQAMVLGQPQVLEKLRYKEIERPIIAQLSGKNPNYFFYAAIVVCYLGFDGIDINLGCPSRNVVKSGGGAALIEKYDTVQKVIKAVRKGVKEFEAGYGVNKLPVKSKIITKLNQLKQYSGYKEGERKKVTISVKTRTGFDKPVVKRWIGFLLKQGLDFISLHGRTAKQQYRGRADWDQITQAAKLAKKSPTLLLGNGDIIDQKMLMQKVKQSKVDGVLIGRGALGNPWIFKDLDQLKQTSKPTVYQPTKKERLEFLLKHAENYNKVYQEKGFVSLRKHFGWYCKGFKQAKQLRIKLFQAENLTEVKSTVGASFKGN